MIYTVLQAHKCCLAVSICSMSFGWSVRVCGSERDSMAMDYCITFEHENWITGVAAANMRMISSAFSYFYLNPILKCAQLWITTRFKAVFFNVNVQDSIVNAENRLNQTFSKRDSSQMNEIKVEQKRNSFYYFQRMHVPKAENYHVCFKSHTLWIYIALKWVLDFFVYLEK